MKKPLVVRLREAVRSVALKLKYLYWTRLYGVNLAPSARLSWGVKLDKTNPRGITIGEEAYVASGTLILSHDFCRGLKLGTKIGARCFIGANAIVMPGVQVGEQVIVGSGAVVTKDVPPNSIVAGNPAKIIRTGIETGKWGVLRADN